MASTMHHHAAPNRAPVLNAYCWGNLEILAIILNAISNFKKVVFTRPALSQHVLSETESVPTGTKGQLLSLVCKLPVNTIKMQLSTLALRVQNTKFHLQWWGCNLSALPQTCLSPNHHRCTYKYNNQVKTIQDTLPDCFVRHRLIFHGRAASSGQRICLKGRLQEDACVPIDASPFHYPLPGLSWCS